MVGALADADQVVLGPGSLFTSVLAAAVVDAVRDAIKRSPGPAVYVCNVRAEAGETRGYDVAAHVAALRRHGVEPDVVVAQQGRAAVGDRAASRWSRPTSCARTAWPTTRCCWAVCWPGWWADPRAAERRGRRYRRNSSSTATERPSSSGLVRVSPMPTSRSTYGSAGAGRAHTRTRRSTGSTNQTSATPTAS